MEPVLELRDITKKFPGVIANDQISIDLKQGEIHALLGENGAGKTTLMNILYGLYKPDQGDIFVKGNKLNINTPNDAIQAGVGMVHQHFMLIPVFTVVENVMLGDEYLKMGSFLDRKKVEQRIREISQQYNLQVDPSAYVKDLPVGIQQRVEIIKLLFRNADILILDEPTAVLTPQEVDELFKIMKTLVSKGKSIILITHKLREVMEFADRTTVIRSGKVVGTKKTSETNQLELASMMVGRQIMLNLEKKPADVKENVLVVSNLKVLDAHHQVAVEGISFEVRSGEVLGVAGVQGNGQTELVRALTGLAHPVEGDIYLLEKNITHANVKQITELGTAHIPEDRQQDGLVLSYSIEDNLILNTWYKEPFSHNVILQDKVICENAQQLVSSFDIRTPSVETETSSLSGGNQQKVIVAREFSRPIKLLIASQPTRGLDVGSIEYIHNRIIDKRDDGCAVLLVSTELDEIMQLSDRIAVMYRGQILAIVDAKTTTREEIGLLMAGIAPEAH